MVTVSGAMANDDAEYDMTRPGDLTVVWTRGKGCQDLAHALGGGPERISGDLAKGCIDQKADLLVSRRLPSNFDLVNVAVPIDFDAHKVRNVVATVSGGPHSLLAAQTASQLAESLGVEAEMVFAVSDTADVSHAHDVLAAIGSSVPQLGSRVVHVDTIDELPSQLDEGTLAVIGAPGGSWMNRSRTGPGARLRRTAQAGVVVVQSAPDRVYQHMGEPVYVGPLRTADDTLRLHPETTLAVADQGRLIGLVRRSGLMGAGSRTVGSVMEDAQSVRHDEPLISAWDLEPTFGGDPIPVTDHEEHLVGGLSLPVAQ